MARMTPDELRALRKEAGLTQAALAEAIGLSRPTIVLMEGGRMPVERRTELAVRYVVVMAGRSARAD